MRYAPTRGGGEIHSPFHNVPSLQAAACMPLNEEVRWSTICAQHFLFAAFIIRFLLRRWLCRTPACRLSLCCRYRVFCARRLRAVELFFFSRHYVTPLLLPSPPPRRGDGCRAGTRGYAACFAARACFSAAMSRL